MADRQVLSTLRRKQADIEEAIAVYEAKIEEARRDLSAVNATIRIFEVNSAPRGVKVYTDLHRLFKWGEMAGRLSDRAGRRGIAPPFGALAANAGGLDD